MIHPIFAGFLRRTGYLETLSLIEACAQLDTLRAGGFQPPRIRAQLSSIRRNLVYAAADGR
jgi:hypothetical protein